MRSRFKSSRPLPDGLPLRDLPHNRLLLHPILSVNQPRKIRTAQDGVPVNTASRPGQSGRASVENFRLRPARKRPLLAVRGAGVKGAALPPPGRHYGVRQRHSAPFHGLKNSTRRSGLPAESLRITRTRSHIFHHNAVIVLANGTTPLARSPAATNTFTNGNAWKKLSPGWWRWKPCSKEYVRRRLHGPFRELYPVR